MIEKELKQKVTTLPGEVAETLAVERFYYDNKIVKMFAYAVMFWGVVGMLAGLLAALQIYYPVLNFTLPATIFGRVRPVHTNAVVFAFVGNGIFMGVYYSLQRLCKARMFSDKLSKIHFWGWQGIIVAGAITLLMGPLWTKNMLNWNGLLTLPLLLCGWCLVLICLAPF